MKKKEAIGKITKIRYRNSDNWAVFSVDGMKHNCTGVLPETADVDTVVKVVYVETNSKFGPQNKCESIIPEKPRTDSREGVIKLLQKMPGIGPVAAKDAVDSFGHEFAWFCAKEHPSVLSPRITYENAVAAINMANMIEHDYDNLVYLLGIGLTNSQASKIINEFGADASKTVQKNPYILIEKISGFGFKTVDKIAIKAGVPLTGSARIMACVKYLLESSEKNDGNIWFHGRVLIEMAQSELLESAMSCGAKKIKTPGYDDIKKALWWMADEGKLIIDGVKVYSKRLYDAEQKILSMLTVDV